MCELYQIKYSLVSEPSYDKRGQQWNITQLGNENPHTQKANKAKNLRGRKLWKSKIQLWVMYFEWNVKEYF